MSPTANHFLKVEKIGDMTCADLTVFHVPQTLDPSPHMLAFTTSGEEEAYKRTWWVGETGAGKIPVSVQQLVKLSR